MSGVFRRPHDYRPSVGVIAVLFPVVAADSPPLRQPPSQQLVAAAYREAFPFPVRVPFPMQIFQTPQDAPLARPMQQMGVFRDAAAQPNPQKFPFQLFPETPPPTIPPQSRSQEAWTYPARPAVPNWIFEASVNDALLRLSNKQSIVAAAYREDGQPYRQRLPQPQTINIPPDSPAIQHPALLPQYAALAAFRDYLYPGPTGRATGATWLSIIVDSPPLQAPGATPQALGSLAYRDATYPGPTPRAGFTPWLSALRDAPPLVTPAGAMQWLAYRDSYPNPTGRLPYPAPLQSPPDAPPLASVAQRLAHAAYRDYLYPGPTGRPTFAPWLSALRDTPPLFSVAQALAQAAWRPDYSPARGGKIPFNVFDPVVVDSPPLQQLTQRLTHAAYRGDPWPIWAAIGESMRMEAALALLFPAAEAPAPSPIVAATNATALTAAQVAAMRGEIADLKRILRQLVAVLEKKGFKI